MMRIDVPPKKRAKPELTPKYAAKPGIMEIKPRIIAPGNVIRVVTESINSAVFSPGFTPGMNAF